MSTVAPWFDGSQPCRADTDNPADINQLAERFFATPGSDPRGYREARLMCAGCHFRAPCLDYALRNNVDGIWGGKDGDERRQLRRQRGIRALPVIAPSLMPELGCNQHTKGSAA